MRTTISIDPGASGAIAWYGQRGEVHAENMPEGMTGICDRIRELAAEFTESEAVVEKVGGYMPGNAGPAAATFARHCGNLEAALYMAKVPIAWNPTPQQWMKRIGVPVFPKALPPSNLSDKEALQHQKAEATRCKGLRKAWIKEWVARRFPSIRVTLSNADALAMLLAMEMVSTVSTPSIPRAQAKVEKELMLL